MKHVFLVFPAENVRVQRNICFSGKMFPRGTYRTIPFEKRQKTWLWFKAMQFSFLYLSPVQLMWIYFAAGRLSSPTASNFIVLCLSTRFHAGSSAGSLCKRWACTKCFIENVMILIGDSLSLADSQHHKSYKREDNLYVDERYVLA